MDWQQLVSLSIVGITGCAFMWSRFGRRKFSFARDTHCGCAAAGGQVPQHSVVYRARKGERPQVVIKFR